MELGACGRKREWCGRQRASTAEAQPSGQGIPHAKWTCGRSSRRALCLLRTLSGCDDSIPPLTRIAAGRNKDSVSSPVPLLWGPADPL